MPVGVALLDGDFRIEECNAAVRALIDEDAPAGRNFTDFIAEHRTEEAHSLAKPFSLNQLAGTVKNAIERVARAD